MTFTLQMPAVGETVTEGTIERWLKQPGDHVDKYEPIVEINTDKVNVELPSPVSGTLLAILAPEGETVAVGAALATIEAVAGEVPTAVTPAATAEAPAAAAAPAAPAAVPARPEPSGEPRRATPRVRRLAQELSVDLERVSGTGPGGRITEEDVRAAAEAKPPAAVAAPGQEEETVPLTAIRRTIAQRMAASAFSAPHAWLVMEADVTGLVRLREVEREAFRQRHGVDLTYLPFAAHAVAQALTDHSYLNASWAEDGIVLKKRAHLGIAVATERGLLVPVVRDAGRLSVAALAATIHDLSERARAGKLRLEDVQGGTFTLDNTGAFGSIVSMPIINQGQAAILSLEAITRRPVVVDEDAIAVRAVVNLCLSFDHRILDGAQAGAFLADVKRRLEAFQPGSEIE
ncbi:MAG TPA: dihydrolipoamide acetyltransferase family protein [Dehalococcoidia bacterium]|nr:dihydrolipoamide acetyltransferase family protein [Dehalococcoidia bacterium]